jgi:hypothetical protein
MDEAFRCECCEPEGRDREPLPVDVIKIRSASLPALTKKAEQKPPQLRLSNFPGFREKIILANGRKQVKQAG